MKGEKKNQSLKLKLSTWEMLGAFRLLDTAFRKG